MTTNDEADKRRELQLILLREGATQDEARTVASEWTMPQVEEMLERMREHAMKFPERQILPPGSIDLADMKRQRQYARDDAEEEKYFAKRDQLGDMMAQSFSVHEMPTAVMMALLDVLDASGVDLVAAMTDLIKFLEFQRTRVAEKKEEKS